MILTLPYPPSINHYWRYFRGRTVISQEGRAFRRDVCALLAPAPGNGGGPRKPPSGGRIALAMDAFPPDRRRRDLDNLQKPVLDALEYAGVYEDDSQVDLLVTRRCEVVPDGRLGVRVMDFPLAQCPVCGAEMN
ncbi:MAG: RusA family crossover junction endodeoxyribonuclease [Phycisphaeraceae bacterium]|nr:RusA family crossover junction endodeoxyribonuclease [Phycisphaeraceae bacterium]